MKNAALSNEPEVRTITAADFKAKCLQLMDEVNEKKLTIIITKRGKPVMEVKAPAEEEFVSLWGASPLVEVPDSFKGLEDWPDPAEKWERANSSKTVDRKRK